MPDQALPEPWPTAPRRTLSATTALAVPWLGADPWIAVAAWAVPHARNIRVTYGPPRTRGLTTEVRTRRLELALV